MNKKLLITFVASLLLIGVGASTVSAEPVDTDMDSMVETAEVAVEPTMGTYGNNSSDGNDTRECFYWPGWGWICL